MKASDIEKKQESLRFGHSIRSRDGCHRIEEFLTGTIGQWYSANGPAFLSLNGKEYISFPYESVREIRNRIDKS